jgi:hypothetical protein
MSFDEQINLLDELQDLLERQIKLARQNCIGEIEVLSERANCLAAKIAQSGIVESGEFKNRRQQLRRLYEDLYMSITAQRADISEKLRRVRKGKRTIKAYRNSI